ncbi:uncharacterized protein LTR77_008218 [Saxophila tyrrhenica]|uniref:C2H2-type domain-containing protein n=1 Tax=Saxophila tyrrhenica TaxID=1690608 RepID=A0AAV9P685_9PEZI|nr:hypothetical protein LTR77_008218 [Saxophila tyrrhenica]
MFHNVCTMSNLQTPTRTNRGLIVPGIDTTKSSLGHPSGALSYGGLHTPPQSAHESRRPSLQYPTSMDLPHSANSSSFGYSHPSTPVHMTHSNGLLPSNTGSLEAQLESLSAPSAVRRASHFTVPILHAPFELQPSSIDADYPHTTQQGDPSTYEFDLGVELPTTEGWRPSQQAINSYGTQSTFLGPALFPASHSMAPDNSPSHATFNNMSSSFHESVNPYDSTYTSGFHEYNNAQLYAPAPQVVVPSQLSPHDDFASNSWTEYQHAQPDSALLASSFGSLGPDHLDYDMVDPPSPVEAYFAHSEDEEYMTIKPERSVTPSRRSSSRWSTMTNTTATSARSRRRASKRLRTGAKSNACHSHYSQNFNCIVQYEGSGFKIDEHGSVTVDVAMSKKPHHCQHVDSDGKRCTGKFERSEHLKRHMGKHSDERKYPCPLPRCHKAIQRPDNATDHFKTHLRPKGKGKRNEHFGWETLENAILTEYSDLKQCTKLLTNLRRWVTNGMPEASSSRK